MDLRKLITHVRHITYRPDTGGAVTDSELADYINLGQQFIAAKITGKDKQYFCEVDNTLGFVSTQREYDIPEAIRNSLITLVERTDTSPPNKLHEIRFQRRESFEGGTIGLPQPLGADGGYYYIRGQKLGIIPTPKTTTANSLQISYIRQLADLSYGNVASGTSTSIKLATTPTAGDTKQINDYYNGERIIIVSGAGVGQTRTISDYVGSTRLATVDAAWTTTPDTTSMYSFISSIPDQHHEILGAYAAKLVHIKVKDRDGIMAETARFSDLLLMLLSSVEMRTSDSPKYINITGDNIEEFS